MSSGHPSMGTIHASSPGDVVKRLTTPPINLSPSLVETLDLIVIMTHARQYGENARRVKGVYEVETITPEGSPRTNEYISWTPIDDTFTFKEQSTILEEVRQQFGFTQDELEEEIKNRVKVLKWMQDKGYTDFSEVSRVVSEYYKDKDTVLEAVEEDKGEADVFSTQKKMAADTQASQQQMVEGKEESKAAQAFEQVGEVDPEELFGDEDVESNPFKDEED